jgi:cytochrome c oxidase cbb3-type subunit 3
MYFIQFIKKKMLLATALTVAACSSMAQATTPVTEAPATQGSNLLATLLVICTIVLALVIWGMGQALVVISKQVMEKNRTSSNLLNITLLISFALLSQTGFAQTATATAADALNTAPNYGGLSANNFYAFAGVMLIEIAAIFFLAFSIRRVYMELLPEKVVVKNSSAKLSEWWSAVDSKFFTKAVSIEKEADILLDHDYDGIKELDNSLPPWWKYGFIITIIFAFVYIGIFHVFGNGKNPTEEYAAEMEKAKMEIAAFEANNKDKIDEKNVPMADAAGISTAKVMFEANCVACHLIDGGGNVGPNLTDDYWIHKGSLNDIYNTIKMGYPDKGMQSWSTKFSPKEMSQLASYVKSLRGTKPATPKAPQGDLYVEVKTDSIPAGAPAKIDSVKIDSAKIVKAVK